jgi:GTP cyclohydrolase FolE2
MDDWVVACTHFESIHQHDVVAICRAGKKLV